MIKVKCCGRTIEFVRGMDEHEIANALYNWFGVHQWSYLDSRDEGSDDE